MQRKPNLENTSSLIRGFQVPAACLALRVTTPALIGEMGWIAVLA
jgi:hypothetical protein